MNDFVIDANIGLYLERLGSGLDGDTRRILLGLLVEEESKLGRTREHLDKAERRVADGKARISRQRALIDGLTLDGSALDQAKVLLRELQMTQDLLMVHLMRLQREVDRSRL